MKRLFVILTAFILIGILAVPAAAVRQGSIAKVLNFKGWHVQKDNLSSGNIEVTREGSAGQDKRAVQAQIKANNRTMLENDRMLLRLKIEINRQNQLVNYKLSQLKKSNGVPTDAEAVKNGLAALKEDRQILNQALVTLNSSKKLLNSKRQASQGEIIKAQEQYLAVQQRCINLMQAVLGDLKQIQQSL